MTATVVEAVPGAISGGGATNNFTVTTTLIASDVIVVVSGLRVNTNTVTLGGLGGISWTQDFTGNNGGARGLRAWHASGATGSGTVSITHSGSATRATVLVLRGLNSTTLEGVQQTVFDSLNKASAATPSQSFGQDQVAVLAAFSSTTSVTFTIPSGATPASGWTVDDNTAGGNPPITVAHIIGTSAGTVVGGVAFSASALNDCVCLVYGTATSSGPPPLTSTFVGWGNPIF